MTGFVGYSNESLADQPEAKAGDELMCWHCGEVHVLEAAKDESGKPSELLLFFKCDEKTYLGAVAGRWIVNVKPDASGKVEND